MEITRFAPSPTGHLHIGGARTALFSWLYAKSKNGKFLLRFEDTDKERSKDEYCESILNSLNWLGIDIDGEPVYQSQNIERHTKLAYELLEKGFAYSCDCSEERLAEIRTEQQKNKQKPKYDGKHRNDNLEHKQGNVIRFKMPDSGYTSFDDQVLGEIKVNNIELDDFIILRGDGNPTYNFSAAVDDMDMGITTVVRGDDHLTNTLKQINVFNALGYKIPRFAHLPMVLSESGKRLSKRDGALDLFEYKNMGYLEPTIINYLVKLGWSYSDQEIFSKNELIQLFSLDSVNSSPSKYSEELLNWYNNYYIKDMEINDLVTLIRNDYNISYNLDANIKTIEIFNLMREGVKTLIELIDMSEFFYTVPDYKEIDRSIIEDSKNILVNFNANLGSFSFDSHETLEADVKKYIKDNDLKFPQIGKPLRIILSGRENAPSISELIYLLGKEETNKRIALFI